jgi:TonB-dependent starch-binding outer membrane protein SusC
MKKRLLRQYVDITLSIMKFTLTQAVIVTLVASLAMATDINGQDLLDKKITVKAENATLKKILGQIERKTEIQFTYSPKIIDDNQKANLVITDKKLSDVLNELLVPLGIEYQVIGKGISLFKTKTSDASGQYGELDVSGSATALAIRITGKVTDEGGQPMPGVNILVKSTTNGTSTSADGTYVLEVEESNSVLVFSFIGYKSQEVEISNRTQIDVILVADIETLGEIVVTGYGTNQARRDITGAVGLVNADQIRTLPLTGLDQAMQGRIAGVQVTQNSGEPGGGVSVRIRGAGSISNGNEPLYIVDGVPYSNLNAINPNDVEKIDVLKDASTAAIYGSRATNGVVMVTTRRGKAGKLTVNFDAYTGVENVYKKMDLLDGPQFAKLANEHLINGGTFAPNPVWNNPQNLPNSDWQDAVFRTGKIQNYTVSVSGGSDKATTLFSMGYFKHEGIILASDYERYNLRLNQDFSFSEKLKGGVTINGAFIKENKIDWSSSFNGVLQVANSMQPTMPITTDIDGFFGYRPDGTVDPNGNTFYGWEGYAIISHDPNIVGINREYYDFNLANPIHFITKYSKIKPKRQNILTSGFLQYEPIKGLIAKSVINLTFDYASDFNSRRIAPAAINLSGSYRTSDVNVFEYNDNRSSWNWINSLTYGRKMGEHNLSVTAAIDVLEGNNGKFINANAKNAPDNAQSITAGTDRTVTGHSFIPSSLISYIGRATYDYEGKYFLAATVRRDGSSKFSESNRWGTFPSVSAGWRISQESFFKSVSFIDDLKLRGSYGLVGNQNIDDLLYISTYFTPVFDLYTIGDGQRPVNVSQPGRAGNSNLKWEESSQTNIGLDASFLSGKLSLAAEYYIKKIYDMLGNFPVPNYLGIPGNAVTKNGFSMENKGIEISLGYRRTFGPVNFSANANFATLHNEVTELTGGPKDKDYIAQGFDGGGSTRTYVGQTVGGFYGHITDGIIQNNTQLVNGPMEGVDGLIRPGDRTYKDLDGNNFINGEDRALLGNGIPGYTYGLSLQADYKGFDLSVLLNGQGDVQAANLNKFYLYDMRYFNGPGLTNVTTDMLNSWSGEGSTNSLPRNSDQAPNSNRWFSDFHIEDASFLRIRNVQIGYTLPQQITQKVGMSRARIYLGASNLFTFTNYSGYDPEIGSRNQSVLQTGVDAGRYPLARSFMLGVNCSF